MIDILQFLYSVLQEFVNQEYHLACLPWFFVLLDGLQFTSFPEATDTLKLFPHFASQTLEFYCI